MYKQFISAKNLIENTLKENPETRDSDRKLMLKIWEKQGWKLTDDQKDYFFKRLISPEVIRRTRQKLQAEGKYKPSEETAKKRESEQRAMRGEVLSEDEKMKRFSQQCLV